MSFDGIHGNTRDYCEMFFSEKGAVWTQVNRIARDYDFNIIDGSLHYAHGGMKISKIIIRSKPIYDCCETCDTFNSLLPSNDDRERHLLYRHFLRFWWSNNSPRIACYCDGSVLSSVGAYTTMASASFREPTSKMVIYCLVGTSEQFMMELREVAQVKIVAAGISPIINKAIRLGIDSPMTSYFDQSYAMGFDEPNTLFLFTYTLLKPSFQMPSKDTVWTNDLISGAHSSAYILGRSQEVDLRSILTIYMVNKKPVDATSQETTFGVDSGYIMPAIGWAIGRMHSINVKRLDDIFVAFPCGIGCSSVEATQFTSVARSVLSNSCILRI